LILSQLRLPFRHFGMGNLFYTIPVDHLEAQSLYGQRRSEQLDYQSCHTSHGREVCGVGTCRHRHEKTKLRNFAEGADRVAASCCNLGGSYVRGADVLQLLLSLILLMAITGTTAQAATQQTAPPPPVNQGFAHPKILEGLTTVSVFVAKVDSWLSSHGVVTATLKSAAEQKLQAAGLTIAPEPALQQLGKGEEAPPPVPILYIHIKSTPEPAGTYASYSAVLTLVETATTKRGAHDVMVSVWDQNEVGLVNASMNGEIDRAVNVLVDDFLRDYRKANGKSSP
jgi:hypothetical protein